MKKILQYLIALLLLSAFLLVMAPLGLHIEALRHRMIDQLNQQLPAELTVADLAWVWLPSPHLVMKTVTITEERLTMAMPWAHLYPDWGSVWGGGELLRLIVVEQPDIRIHSWQPRQQAMTATEAPAIFIRIHEGEVTMAVPAAHRSLFRTDTIRLQSINGSIRLAPTGVQLDLAGSASFCDQLEVRGEYAFKDITYELAVRTEGLKLHTAMAGIGTDILKPVESEVNLQGRMTGKGLGQMTIVLQGDFPCFLVKPQDRSILLNCGVAGLTLTKTGSDLELRLDQLKLKEPGLNVSGVVRRTIPSSGATPLWYLDLTGEEINLTEVRAAVLTLWGGYPVARTVADIVRNGRAAKGGFRFSGPAAAFQHLSAMNITADVETADIHVPGADLNLTAASGPIAIHDGYLTGEGLRAQLDASHGSNGSLRLDLTNRSHAFRLDLDLDVDLAALPPILARLVRHPGFQRELHRFSDVQGRASGHLRLGDALDQLAVEVDVDSMAGEFLYDRLQWPVTVEQGRLRVAPSLTRWQDVRVRVGPHRIDRTDGAITWDGQEPWLRLEQLDGLLDGHALHAELAANDMLPTSIARMITALAGSLQLRNTSLTGPVRLPAQWVYRTEITAWDLVWRSPLLPEAVTTETAAAIMQQDRITLTAASLHFMDQPLALHGEFLHSMLDNWHGWVAVDAMITPRLGNWVRDQGWAPAGFFPRLPCTLRQFSIHWNDTINRVGGRIAAGDGGVAAPVLDLDLTLDQDRLLAVAAEVKTVEQQGRFTFQQRDEVRSGRQFTWQGKVTANSLNELWSASPLLSGTLQGDFEAWLADTPENSRLAGELAIRDLEWRRPEGRVPLRLTALHLTSQGDSAAAMADMLLEADNRMLAGRGTVSLTAKKLAVDLDVSAESLAWSTLSGLVTDLDAWLGWRPTALDSFRVVGGINFDVAAFTSWAAGRRLGGEKATPYVWRPLQGTIRLDQPGDMTVDITTARMCCLNMAGSWHRQQGKGGGTFTLDTACATPALFEFVLPCFGIRQDIIEGECELSGHLTGDPPDWKQGGFRVSSPGGRILRLRLLSKIFKLINFTDLFTINKLPDLDKKGFPYTELTLETSIKDNTLRIDKGIIRGEGLNLYGSGEIDLQSLNADITVFIAPLKTLDVLVSKVPLVGRAMGDDTALVAIPVGISGDIRNPEVMILPPDAVGDAAINLIRETLMLPFSILSPMLPKTESR